MLIEQLPVSDFANALGVQLRNGHERLSEWSENKMQLEFATVIGG